MLTLSMQIPSGCLGQELLATPATSLACPPAMHTMISTQPFPQGRVGSHWAPKFMRGHLPARNSSSPLRSSWRWGSSGGGHSSSPSSPSTLKQLEPSLIASSVPQVRGGIWWALSTPASLSRLSLENEGPPLCKGHMPLLLARGIGAPTVWHHLGIFPSLSQGFRSLALATSWVPVTSREPVSAGELAAEGTAHTFSFLLY